MKNIIYILYIYNNIRPENSLAGLCQIMASAAEEVLWADLLSAAKSLPRQPLCDGMASVQGVLQDRLGKTQSAQPSLQQTQNAPEETAWRVSLLLHLPPETHTCVARYTLSPAILT